MVVMRLFVERHASPPVCMSRKQPVPYVFFAWPGWKQHCPNRAACWSPATPQMGTFGTMPAEAVRPNSPDEGSTSGSRDSGMPNRSSSHGSQRSSWMLYSMVRLAFVTSVACTLPWVSVQMSHVSTVPKASLPASASSRAPSTWSRIHLILLAEK